MTIDKVVPRGIYSPVTTFFKSDADYTLDIETQIQHAKFLYENGINGLLLSGSLGEANHLSKTERYLLFSSIRKAIPDPDFKILAGIPPIGNIATILDECRSAKEAGADFAVLLVPSFFGPNLTSQQGIIDYFTRVADESPIALILYNYPGVSNNVTITYETFETLSSHSNIVGVKLTHFNLDIYSQLGQNKAICEENNFRPFTGLGQVLVPALSVGIYGAIDGLSAIFPKTMLRLYNLFLEGKVTEAAELQSLVSHADLMIAELNVVGVKNALKKFYGLGECLTGRPPLSKAVDQGEFSKFQPLLKKLFTLEKSL